MTVEDGLRMPSRMARRAIVIAVYAGYAGIAVAAVRATPLIADMASLTALVCAFAAWGGMFLFMRMRRVWFLGNAPDRDLDEREIALRLRAYHWSYIAFVAAVFLGLIALSLFVDLARPLPFSYEQVSAVLWGIFLLGATLPAAILAWTEQEEEQ